MSASPRPRRSVLYVPGDKPRAIAKARRVPADAVIFDLEDAVAPQAKAEARKQVAAALAEGKFGRRELIVRINPLDGEWGRDDVAALAQSKADAILLPKVESGFQLRQAEEALVAARAHDSLALWCMIETPAAVLHAEEIASASPQPACLVAGATDLAFALNAKPGVDRAALVPALAQIVLAARAAGIACLDSVHLDLDDEQGFEFVCRQGAALGFDGKTLIHPKTIDTANRIFGPGPEEVAHARAVIAAVGEAQAAGKGLTVIDGKLVEKPHLTAAQRLVALAEQIAILVEEAGLAP